MREGDGRRLRNLQAAAEAGGPAAAAAEGSWRDGASAWDDRWWDMEGGGPPVQHWWGNWGGAAARGQAPEGGPYRALDATRWGQAPEPVVARRRTIAGDPWVGGGLEGDRGTEAPAAGAPQAAAEAEGLAAAAEGAGLVTSSSDKESLGFGYEPAAPSQGGGGADSVSPQPPAGEQQEWTAFGP